MADPQLRHPEDPREPRGAGPEGEPPTDPLRIRVSEAEREHALAALRRHYSEGRLDARELELRASRASQARTRGELRALFADLPAAVAAGDAAGAVRRLRRSSQDRWLGGVAGGLGRYFGVDPLLVRLAFVLVTLLAGVGLVAYLAAWLLIPDDTPGAPGAGRRRGLTIAGAVVLVLLALPFLLPLGFVVGPVLFPLALLGIVGVLLVRFARGEDTGTLGRVILIGLLVAVSIVGAIVVGIAAALGGGVVIAAGLIAAGVALVVGAFVGGARWLIVPALIVALGLGVVAAADLDLEGGVGGRYYRPTSTADLREGYDLGAGELRVDLRELRLPQGRTDLRLELGFGEVIVYVPEGVCVASDVELGAGYAEVLDTVNGGFDVKVRDDRAAPAGTPRLVIDADVGLGGLEVRQGPGDFDDWREDGWDGDWRNGRFDADADAGAEEAAEDAADAADAADEAAEDAAEARTTADACVTAPA